MNFGTDFLNSISQKITDRELRYKDTVIIGDNSSGKSLLLKMILEKKGKGEDTYFIDAVNRGFDVSKVTFERRKHEYKSTIIETRLQENIFNMKDSFSCYGTSTERIEEMYGWLEERVQSLFEELTEERFHITPDSVLGEVRFKEGTGLLSSGYQAIVRIFMELLYYQEKCLVEKQMEHGMVIIDELDEFLSPGYAYKIFPFLKKRFRQMEFVITTHSCDLVSGAQNANLIVLDNLNFEVMDVNDYQSVSEVQIIFERIFGVHRDQTSEIENILRRMLNNKISDVWTEEEELLLEQLQKEQLTPSQQLICRQIMEW